MCRWLIWLSLALVTAELDENDHEYYCNARYQRLCQGKGMHVGCMFPTQGYGPACENCTTIKFNEELKHFVLHYINRRRQKIAAGYERVRGGHHLPKPEIMMGVEWDRELAFLAQRLADQCRFTHDDCRATVRYPFAGQTVGEVRWRRSEALEMGAKRSIGRVLDAWWGERRRVTPRQLTSPFKLTSKGAVWGHFSQLAVWTLRAMGCGAVVHGASRPRVLLVCDFSHTNMLGQSTLSTGPPAPCPVHTARGQSSRYSLLCMQLRQAPSVNRDKLDDDDDYDQDTIAPKSKPRTMDIEDDTTQTTTTYETTTTSKAVEKVTTTTSSTRSPETTSEERRINLNMEGRSKSYDKVYNRMWGNLPEETSYYHWRGDNAIGITRKHFKSAVSSRPNNAINLDSGQQPVYNRFTSFRYSEETIARQRWKQTRSRPRRPGANALMITPKLQSSRRHLSVPLTLDKDDVEQLFRDTGFKINR